MEITTPKLGHSRAADGPNNEDILRWRWEALGIEYTDAKLQAAAKDMDEYDARLAKEKAERDLPDEDIDDEEEQPPATAPRQQSVVSETKDDILRALRDDFSMENPEPEAPLPAEPQAAAGVESAALDPVEMIKEAMRAATANKAETPGGKKRKYTKREEIQYAKPLSPDFKYSKILAHFRDDPRWSWPEVAILSEIDVFMIDTKQPCYAGREHYAPLARVGSPTAGNILSVLTRNGIITELGYHPGLPTKDRVVSPEYSSDPELSRNLINKRTEDDHTI